MSATRKDDRKGTTAVTGAETGTTPRPRRLAVFAGGADAIDAALTLAVAPAVRGLAPRRWSFLRWTAADGSHVRVTFEADQDEADELGRRVEAGLERAANARRLEPLLPRPASQRDARAHTGVRLTPAADEGLLEPLHQLSSEVVLDALQELESGRERGAFGLGLMATAAQSALGRGAGPELWSDLAQQRLGEDARGQRLIAQLTRRAGGLREELVESLRTLRRDRVTADALSRYGDGCRGLADPAAVHRHAHLCNRLGVTPLEEALLALVLAGAGRDGHGSAPVVSLQDVTKPDVLDGVSLTVREGEVFVLVGPPNAGKSTLLGIAAGLRTASDGTVRVLDRDPGVARREDRAAAETAVPDGELADDASVRESIELRLRAADDWSPGIADAVLRATELQDLAATAVGDLECGARRRVAIACALVHEPAVLLLDEPTAGLSAVEREEVWRVVARRRERGATTVIAATSIQDALHVGDRAGLIVGGALEALGTPSQIADEFFPERSLRFHTAEEPDRALLEELPDVGVVHIDKRVDHWAVELATRQPRELLALLERDPDFPEPLNVVEDELDAPFAARQA